MPVKIGVGYESFDEIRADGLYYVDKTELLYDLFEMTNNKVTLFTRPRRFGKTLNMSMLRSFFDITRDSRAAFEGLNIMNHPEFCAKWMNQYPVLFITLKDVDGLDFESAFEGLRSVLAFLCRSIGKIFMGKDIEQGDMAIFERLRLKTSTADDIKDSLITIMRMMYTVYGKPVILLIDEYDVPIAKASERNTAQNRYYEQMLAVIRGLLSTALKTNEYLQCAVITGCLRIAKESIFTGTNNFKSYTVLDDDFSQYFGFTHNEVDKLLSAAGRLDKADTIRKWYDGYVFGSTHVYCPWDAVNYIAELIRREDAQPKNFWNNTSGNGIIRDFVRHGNWGIPDKFETLLNGGTVVEEISDELTYDTLHQSEQNIWSILLMTGYLTKANPNETGSPVELRIPNAEIAGIFADSVISLFRDNLDNGRQRELLTALWEGDIETATQLLNDFLWDTISYNDYHEDYYHAFLAGLFVGLGCSVESNRERGIGRFDIYIRDRKHRRAILIEAKKSKAQDDMAADCDRAIQQIVDKGYANRLEPGYVQLICYGIAFYQKTAMLKML